MKAIINILLWILVLSCICIIAYVRLNWGFALWQSDDSKAYNMILENLSYSYLAGCIFYVLTSSIPHYLRTKHLQPVIDSKLKRILQRLEDSKRAVYSITEYNEQHTDDDFIERLSNGDFDAPCAQVFLYPDYTVGKMMLAEKNELLKLIDEVQRLESYMSEKQVRAISELSTSTYFDLLKTLGNPILKGLDSRRIIAQELVKELDRIRTII